MSKVTKKTRIEHDPKSLKEFCQSIRAKGQSVGFTPTMGALHDGHRSLFERSVKENDVSIASIFVNPTQFDDKKDFEVYQRTLEADYKLLSEIGVDVVFVPEVEALYPDDYRYRVSETEFSKTLCGAHRPGHFDGVLTVVLKLLLLTTPDRAYFGEKDWQQYRLIKGLAEAFFLATAIVPCPIVREPSGLALSSRNQRLSAKDREIAASIYKAITNAATPLDARTLLEAKGFTVEYIEDVPDTQTARRRLVAVHFGGVRLIDNVSIRIVKAGES